MRDDHDGLLREVAAEFLGTAVLVSFGLGFVAQKVLSAGDLGSPLSIHLGWGIAVVLGCAVAGGVSGAHLNPAVTLALAVFRGFPLRKLLPYMAAQLAGAFVAAAVVHVTYAGALSAFDGGTRHITGPQATAGIFVTSPQPWLGTLGGLVDQIVATALLCCVVFAVGDRRNAPPVAGLGPIVVGLTVIAIGMGFAHNCGYAVNPARDLGPRLWTALAGWGSGVFTADGHWWWVPVVGPLLGGVLGGGIYEFFIGTRFPERR
jgi:MIP family channel proteins